MSLDYDEKIIPLAKNLQKTQLGKKIICGTIFYLNIVFDFSVKKR